MTRPGAASRRRRPGAPARGPRLRRVDVAVALLLGLLGFAAVVQVRSTQEDGPLAAARQEDLVQILDDLANRTSGCAPRSPARADAARLTSGTGRTEAALRGGPRRRAGARRAGRHRAGHAARASG